MNSPRPIVMPQVVDESEIVMSENNNIEEVYEIFAVFHDSNIPCCSNGGCGNSRELKELTIECLLSRNSCKEATLISKPTRNVLRDYQGDNLLLAYPIQFPYGIGSRDAAGLERVGTEYLKYLCSLSHPNFHQSNWVCVLYNMFERRRMITASYLKTSEEERQLFCNISSEDIAAALVRYKDKKFGNGAADIFFKKMRAVTGSMAHSAQGARTARQKMFAMVASLGLPCVFFTISPEDGVNFRIRVLSKGGKGSECPPGLGLDEDIYRHFLMEGEKIRIEYPGLCAVDFENVIAIVIEYILGWDTRNKCNKPDYGCFGDLEGWTYAVEEQGRKTLHAHFLLWIRGWNDIVKDLGTREGRERYEKEVCKYVDRVTSTYMFGMNPKLLPNVCHPNCTRIGTGIEGFLKCTVQDLRQLRLKHGETSFGDKKLLCCPSCNVKVSSEDLVMERLRNYFGDALIAENESLWSSLNYISKGQLLMEMEILHEMVPPKSHSCLKKYIPSAKVKFILSASTIFGCNTNVIAGVDGGSIMYCTCYVSKNTEMDDVKHFGVAAKQMVKKLQERIMDRMALENEDEEEEISSIGMKGLIGAVLMATKEHKVAAPMASYLIRNHSRFHFSHDFAYVNIDNFLKDVHEDFNISANEKGFVCLKSNVANYLYRPKELEDTCVYFFWLNILLANQQKPVSIGQSHIQAKMS
ncbi:helitron helicase-like protein [Nitzschia inconspicua]|uniref:Helitron helicase-like protein n=1 Tax=Nitzschia inconspicua TaxID=303405 RepID=A0A9K3KZY3_9STRA|nr:helitron helicase-like protein [Nitzschia inconspicua]